jgi:hypothetical protein
LLQPREGGIRGAADAAPPAARGDQHLRAARRSERDGLEVGEQHRDRERHPELQEELADLRNALGFGPLDALAREAGQ